MLRAAIVDDHQLLRESLTASLANAEDPISAAIEHGLAPLLYLRLHDHGLLRYLTFQQRELLRKLHRRMLLLHSGAFGVTHWTLDLLRQAGIERALPLKGVALAAAQWPSPLLRSLVDVDVLVPPDQALLAKETLKTAGYAAPDIPWAPTRWEYHLPRLECHGLGVELHWRLWPPSPLLPFRLPRPEALWARSVTALLDERPLRVPSKPDQLLIMAAALAQDGFAVGLRAWADVYWLAQVMEPAEVEQARQLAEELGCHHYLALMLEFLKVIIGPVQVETKPGETVVEAFRELEPVIWHRLLTAEPRRSSVWMLRVLCGSTREEEGAQTLPSGLEVSHTAAHSAIVHSGGLLLTSAKAAGRLGRWLVSRRERQALREDLMLCRGLRKLTQD